MSDDEPILTAREERAAAGLRLALRDVSQEWPLRVDAAAWVASVQRQRSIGRRLPVGIAAALVVVLVAAVAVFAGPRIGIGKPAETQAHYDNGQFAFDYSSSWRTIATDSNGLPVLGTGDWGLGCPGQPSASGCGEEITDISGGRIVLTMWVQSPGPPAYCSGNDALETAPLGTGWIRRYDEDARYVTQPTTRWEIRRPGYDFGMTGNLWIQAVTDNPAELANAAALVATFRWEKAGDYCQSPTVRPSLPGTAGHFDNGRFSFDYPAGWTVLAGDYYEAMAYEVVAVLGTGVFRSGCTWTDNGAGCTGDAVDVNGGRVVVKIYERVGGPAPTCQGDVQANATLGPNAVQLTTGQGSALQWEIRLPGYEFGWPNNIFVEAWTSGDLSIAQVEALVASFRWASSVSNAGNCAPLDTPAPTTGMPGPS